MRYKIVILAFLLAIISFGGGIPTPPIDEELSPQTRNYFKTLYDNHNKFEVTTTNPNGSRLGSVGDSVLLRTGTSYDLYTCVSSPSGTSWLKTNQSTDNDEKVKASSTDTTADYLDGKVAKSVVITSNKLELSGDVASPGNSYYYGTNSSGTKGWNTVSTFVDRGDPASIDFTLTSFTTDGTWRDFNLSSIAPAGAKAVLLRVDIRDDLTESVFQLRENGNSSIINVATLVVLVANIKHYADIIVSLDTNRIIEYFATNTTWTSINVTVAGWWT